MAPTDSSPLGLATPTLFFRDAVLDSAASLLFPLLAVRCQCHRIMNFRLYIDLDALIESREVKYVGSSVASAEEWHLRQRYQPVAQDVFGEDARLKNGQVLKFRETAVRILAVAGWQPGAASGSEGAVEILRDHMTELAGCIEIKASRDAAAPIATDE